MKKLFDPIDFKSPIIFDRSKIKISIADEVFTTPTIIIMKNIIKILKSKSDIH